MVEIFSEHIRLPQWKKISKIVKENTKDKAMPR